MWLYEYATGHSHNAGARSRSSHRRQSANWLYTSYHDIHHSPARLGQPKTKTARPAQDSLCAIVSITHLSPARLGQPKTKMARPRKPKIPHSPQPSSVIVQRLMAPRSCLGRTIMGRGWNCCQPPWGHVRRHPHLPHLPHLRLDETQLFGAGSKAPTDGIS